MVLVVTPGDGGPELAAEGAFLGSGVVVAVKGDGGGVVVQLVQLDGELAHGVGGDVEDQGGDVGVEELVEGASDAVVVECGELALGKPEQGWIIPRGPLADAVEWGARDEQVACQQEQCRGVGDAVAAVLARQPATQRFVEAQRAEEAVEEGQCPDLRELRVCPPAWASAAARGMGSGCAVRSFWGWSTGRAPGAGVCDPDDGRTSRRRESREHGCPSGPGVKLWRGAVPGREGPIARDALMN